MTITIPTFFFKVILVDLWDKGKMLSWVRCGQACVLNGGDGGDDVVVGDSGSHAAVLVHAATMMMVNWKRHHIFAWNKNVHVMF